ncbi:hypothetical protein Lal_00043765 [Lupinus albus]|nr:hypothetical protein Lal_00043765 [Lupinus albus]
MKPYDVQEDRICLKVFPHSLEGPTRSSDAIVQQQNYDPSSTRYIPGWRNHPQAPIQNSNAGFIGPYVFPPIQQQKQHQVINNPPLAPSETSLEELTVLNPKNVSVITLRSGKQNELLTPTPYSELEKTNDTSRHLQSSTPSSSASQQPFFIPLPIPPKIIPSKKMENMEEVDKELLDTLRKVEVNISLLDVVKHIPRYAKFLKGLCTHKRKLKGNERISIGRNVSALIGKHVPYIPEKFKDP